MTSRHVIQGAIGSKGTTFLTGQCILAHLQDGEEISPVPCDVEFWAHPEVGRAIRELQAQHRDMLHLIQELPIDECADELFDKWEVSRVG